MLLNRAIKKIFFFPTSLTSWLFYQFILKRCHKNVVQKKFELRTEGCSFWSSRIIIFFLLCQSLLLGVVQVIIYRPKQDFSSKNEVIEEF